MPRPTPEEEDEEEAETQHHADEILGLGHIIAIVIQYSHRRDCHCRGQTLSRLKLCGVAAQRTSTKMLVRALVALTLASISRSSDAFSASSSSRTIAVKTLQSAVADIEEATDEATVSAIFEDFAGFLIDQQTSIINELEKADGKGTFTNDRWGCFDDGATDDGNTSGGKSKCPHYDERLYCTATY